MPQPTSATDPPPERVELRVGEELTITLPGLGTAGYAWEPQVEGPAETLEIERRIATTDPAANAVGASSPEVFNIKATRPGHIRLRLAQRRPWERDKPPLSSHEIDVTIN